MPIKWVEWSKAAFQKGARQKKPILLDIYGVWCHWCHRMDEEYEKKKVIEFVNNNFIPVHVDTDKRPDINEKYNQGGWPTTAVLDPRTGEVLTGATYLPALQLLYFLNESLDKYNWYLKQKPVKAKPKKEKQPPQLKNIAPAMLHMAKEAYDPMYGGFGGAPKFPQWDILRFLIHHIRRGRNGNAKNMLVTTLQNMAQSGFADKVEGGFYRYATQRDWNVPHYEKMLEDNAHAIDVYLCVARLTGHKIFLGTARFTATFLINRLYNKRLGGFGGSQDADEEYAAMTLPQRKKRKPPYVDPTIYTNYNAMTVISLIHAWVSLDEPEFKKIATKTLSSLLTKMVKNGKVYHSFANSKAFPPFLLRDNAWLALAATEAYTHTGDKKYLKSAVRLVNMMLKNFWDKKNSGFFDTLPGKDAVGLLTQRTKSYLDTAIAALVLFRLGEATKKPQWKKLAQKALQVTYNETLSNTPYAARFAEVTELVL